jgi:AcrR family transcriptional regulator
MRVKSESRRQGIIDVACQAFRELGFEAASMSEISARVGGSKATLYNYFSSKEELFVAAMRQFADNHMEGVFRLLDPSQALAPTLQAFGERFLLVLCRPELVCAHRNLFAEAGKSEVGRLFYERGPLEGLQVMTAYLEQCMALGKLREADPFVAAQHLTALLKAEMMDRLLLGVQDSIAPDAISPMVARAVDVFLRAYASPA